MDRCNKCNRPKHLPGEVLTALCECETEDGQVDAVVICDGCNVRSPWEHRCFGEGCGCDEPVCMQRQGRITHEELMDIVNKHLESK